MSLPDAWVKEIERAEDIVTAMAKDHALRDSVDAGALRMYQVEEPSVVLAYRTSHGDLKTWDVAHTRAKRDGDSILCREDDFLYSLTIPLEPGQTVSRIFHDIGPVMVDALTSVTYWERGDLGLDPTSYGPRFTGYGDWETPGERPDGPLVVGNSPWWGRDTVQVQGIIPYSSPDLDTLKSYFHIPEHEEEAVRRFPGIEDFTSHSPKRFFKEMVEALGTGLTGKTPGEISEIEYRDVDMERFLPTSPWVEKGGKHPKQGKGYCMLASEETENGTIVY